MALREPWHLRCKSACSEFQRRRGLTDPRNRDWQLWEGALASHPQEPKDAERSEMCHVASVAFEV